MAGAPRPPAPPIADPDGVACAASLLAAARRPLVLLGGGAADAGPEALAVARSLAAPVGLTINGRGTVPDADPLCLGSALSFAPVSDLLRAADATLLVGAQLSDLELWGLSEPLELPNLVRVDIDAEQLDRRWPAAVGLHGDAAATLAALRAAAAGSRQRPPAPRSPRRSRGVRAALEPPAEVARFSELVELLDRVLPARPDHRRRLHPAGLRRQPSARHGRAHARG